jgi:hypothetical protein
LKRGLARVAAAHDLREGLSAVRSVRVQRFMFLHLLLARAQRMICAAQA